MPKTRELIDQIIEVRERRQFNHTMSELFSRLSTLEIAFEKRDVTNQELLKYFPVALVACMEGYFRLAINQFIDEGQPFLDNASELISNIKFDFDVVKALNEKQVTVGELISHHISLNNLAQIQSNISKIIKRDFLKELGSTCSRWEYEVLGKEKAPILQDSDQVYKSVSRTFELRHIICHELASGFTFDFVEIEKCFLGTVLFLKATDELFNEILHPDSPLTQLDMNMKAGETLRCASAELEILNQSLCGRLGVPRVTEFVKVDSAWRTYMELHADFEADAFRGGSIRPMIYAGVATITTHSRINEVKKIIDRINNS
jgi:uncharacterized protein YecT (DUF1311 family)